MTPYYERDGITIYHGDCRGILPDLRCQMVVTSPPYFNARAYSQWESYADYLAFMDEAIGAMADALDPGRMVAINSSPVIEPRKSRSHRSKRFNIPGDIHYIASRHSLWFQEEIVWAKPEGAAINRNQRFSLDRHPLQWRANPQTERIGVYQKPTHELNDRIIARYGGIGRIEGDYDRGDLWHINPETRSSHPAPFPYSVPQRLIRYYTWPGDVVIDPFMGSGTTLLAARDMGRKAIGIELDERYCEVAAQRLQQAQQAVMV